MEKASVSVKIYNETYSLRTAAPKEQVLKIADEVDRRMKALADKKNIQSAEKLAVWTSLDLAADFLELKQRYERLLSEVRER